MDGHLYFKRTLIYADYCPSAHEAEIAEGAFETGTNSGTNLSETESTSEHPTWVEQAR